MKIGKKIVKMIKMKNRKGFAALCDDHLTEGATQKEAYDRMVKALQRTERKMAKKKK